MTFRSQLLGGLWSRAHMSPVEDAGAAAVVAEAVAPAPVDAEAGQDHQTADDAQAAGSTREADDAEARGEPAAEPEKKTRQPWQDKRISKLTADAKAAAERAEAAERRALEADQRAAAYESLYGRPEGSPAPAGAPPAPASGERTYTQADLQAEAVRIANVTRLNERIDGIFEAGVKSKGAEWNTRVNQAATAFSEDLKQRPDLFEALVALPNPDAVYYELAGDLDHMAEVLAMPPVQLGMELARLSQKAGAPTPGPRVSRAPAPISPLDTSAPEEVPLDKMPMEDYAKTREVQAAERQNARR